jgi:phosphate transport system substrate-binding protein
MSKYIKIGSAIALVFVFFYCNKKQENTETMVNGNTEILVDETLTPIIEGEVAVFESDYTAKIKIKSKSETEVLQSLLKDSVQIAILSKKLSVEDSIYLTKRKIFPKQTMFATDAIALISNKSNNDTIIALQDVIDFMKGKTIPTIKGLVFDNPNSSTVRLINKIANLKVAPEKGIFSFKTNEEVIKYVSENKGMIGVVGVNWLMEPTANIEKYKENIQILSVKPINGTQYYYPSQNNLAEKTYPLARDLYIVNCQTFAGLGNGFGVFMTGDRGQRIILKSGLLPIKIPGRNISVQK